MENAHYQIELDVRDYECDLQGIVNNSVYQNYYEHTRHKFIKDKLDLDFAELHNQGIDAIVYRVEIDFKASLVSGDTFISSLRAEQEGMLKIIFNQQINRKSDGKLMSKAKITTATLKNGRPAKPEMFTEALSKIA